MAAHLTEGQKALIIADRKAGYPYDQLADRHKVSKATVHKVCKGISTINAPRVKELVEAGVQEQLDNSAVHLLAQQKLLDLEFFRNSSKEIAEAALQKVRNYPDMPMKDFESAQNIMARGKETIFGKSPETAIQINNNKDTNKPHTDLSHLTLQEKLAIKAKVFPNE
jgi:DNA-binding MurR/RpiR family transcriptional regulator